MLLSINIVIDAAITASFLLTLYLTIDKRYFIICLSFFIAGFISFSMYYNINFTNKLYIRTEDSKGSYFIGNSNGRKIIVKGKTRGITEGSKILAEGKFTKDLDYSRGIAGTFYINSYEPCSGDIISRIYETKRYLYKRFSDIIGSEDSSLIMSLCYGDTSYLSNSGKSKLQNLGVIHAVSVSGLHMSLIYSVLEGTIGFIPAIFVSFIYIVFTGLQASAIRAFLMIFLARLSKKIYKNYDSLSSISFAGIILIALRPYYITDLGFILSFLATLGIILYYNKIRNKLYLLPAKLNSSLSITLSAQIFTLPYIAFTLQNFSFAFLPANLLLVPIYSAVMIMGNLALLLININPLFLVLCKLLSLLLSISSSVSYSLLKVFPEAQYMGYDVGLTLLFCYFLYYIEKYYHSTREVLLCYMVILLLIRGCVLFPQINFMESKSAKCIFVKYRYKTTAICNFDETNTWDVQNILKSNPYDRLITNPDNGCSVKLSRSFLFLVDKKNSKAVKLIYHGSKIILPLNFKLLETAVSSTSSYGIIKPQIKSWYLILNKLVNIP